MQTKECEFRIEKDGLGEEKLPKDAVYGIHSLRASRNFPISMRGIDDELILNLARVKKAAAIANEKAGHLSGDKAEAIIYACNELLAGRYHDAFLSDVMQGGAGTSIHMNACEVIANVAIKHLGGRYGDYSIVHPLDHVNMCQSTNDVIPTAAKLTALDKTDRLLEALRELQEMLNAKSAEFDSILMVGRTQLQDAVPMRAGQMFKAYAAMIKRSIAHIKDTQKLLHYSNMGGSAIGSSINVDRKYYDLIIDEMSAETGRKLYRCEDLFDGTQNADDFAAISSAVKVCALKLSKMASDLRLLASGPMAGLGEVHLPPRQSGSTIMPGKINPVIPEALNQAAFLVIGHDATISVAVEGGQLELNVFLPVIMHQLFEEIDILANAIRVFTENCLKDIQMNAELCKEHLDKSFAVMTALNPRIGYDKSTQIVKAAQKSRRPVMDIAREYGITEDELEAILEPHSMTELM